MLFRTYGHALLTLHERHSRLLLAARPPGKPPPSPRSWPSCWLLCPPHGGKPSPSITAPSSPGITTSIPSASRRFSVIRMRPGKRAGSKMPSGACAGPCPARPTWPPSRRSTLHAWSKRTIIPPGNVSAIRRPPRFLETICCTSNVNPPSCFRRNCKCSLIR